MTDPEARALSIIAAETDTEKLLQIATNARGRSKAVELAAIRRLASISPKYESGTPQHACWQMIHVIEAHRKLNGRKVCRMNRMRQKISKDGEIEALQYCVREETKGFAEIMNYGMPEMTAEAIVLRYQSHFETGTVEAARARLQRHGAYNGD